jgi:predicted helicase
MRHVAKGMRKSLMATFNQIYVLDLHGNAKKKEHTPNGGEDQNVFDIEQGVAISLFVKNPDLERGVWHGDLWGKRLAKYQAAAVATKSSISWDHLEPESPDWLFKPQDVDLGRRYREFWSIPKIFSPMGDPAPGIVTTQDEFAISFTSAEAQAKGDHSVEAVRYSPSKQAISINDTQFFEPVPQTVWDFHIGGYQVLDKYLKSRKGRALSLDEINHVAAIADSLAFTVEQMTRIDKAYLTAFAERG